jgi:hypothetical protein
MNTKASRPPLKVDEDDLLPQRKPLPSARDDDHRILAAADQLSARHGALRDGSFHAATSPPPAPSRVPPVTASWKLVMPEYLDRDLSRCAAERRVTKSFLVLEALAQSGYDVRPEDLIGDRRRRRP